MIAREVWIDGGVGLRFGGCCDCETGFASELQFFVGGDAPFFAIHHVEMVLWGRSGKASRRVNGRGAAFLI
jgi:hypothetical protein